LPGQRAATAGWPTCRRRSPRLEDRWGITVGERLAGGTASYVATAVTATGEQVVVKISVPGVDFGREVRTLRAAAGRGYVRLLAADLDRNAALLEPLGGSLSGSGLPPERQLAVLADLLPLAWAVPPDRLAPTDKAADLAEFVGAFGRSAVVDEALRCAGRRSAAFDPDAVWSCMVTPQRPTCCGGPATGGCSSTRTASSATRPTTGA
jgi:streptomycin 6-kinase